MNVELIINDEQVDLYSDTSISLVLQSLTFKYLNPDGFTLTDIQAIAGSFNNLLSSYSIYTALLFSIPCKPIKSSCVTTSPHIEFFIEFAVDRNGNSITNVNFESIFISDEGTTDIDRNIKLVTPDNIYNWLPTLNYYKGTTTTGFDGDYVFDAGSILLAIKDNINVAPPNVDNWVGGLIDSTNVNCIWY